MSVGDGTAGVPAGWYPDPADDARLRRWDGDGWTLDVILAPDETPAGFTSPQSPPPAAAHPGPPAPAASAPPPPPSAPSAPFATPSAPAAPASPAAPVDSDSLPEWATLPGLTLPPDLSGIPGHSDDPILRAPSFPEAAESAPNEGWAAHSQFRRPAFVDAPESPSVPSATDPSAPVPSAPVPSAPPARPPSVPEFPPPPSPPRRGGSPTPAENYAPPPAGAQYDVPPPPGATRVPGPSLALPASSLVSPTVVASAWSSATRPPQLSRSGSAPTDFEALPRTTAATLDKAAGRTTVWTWLIALLPLIQFAAIYLIFKQFDAIFAPGTQWGILAAPAALGLLLALPDRRALTDAGVVRAPSPLLAIVPPVYLLVRAVDVGRSSVVPLIVWIVLQAASAVGVVVLLPDLLAQATRSLI